MWIKVRGFGTELCVARLAEQLCVAELLLSLGL